MTVRTTEQSSTIEEIWSSREVYAGVQNAERLAAWCARWPRDAIEVPAAISPAKWPALRIGITDPLNVTPIRKGREKP